MTSEPSLGSKAAERRLFVFGRQPNEPRHRASASRFEIVLKNSGVQTDIVNGNVRRRDDSYFHQNAVCGRRDEQIRTRKPCPDRAATIVGRVDRRFCHIQQNGRCPRAVVCCVRRQPESDRPGSAVVRYFRGKVHSRFGWRNGNTLRDVVDRGGAEAIDGERATGVTGKRLPAECRASPADVPVRYVGVERAVLRQRWCCETRTQQCVPRDTNEKMFCCNHRCASLGGTH